MKRQGSPRAIPDDDPIYAVSRLSEVQGKLQAESHRTRKSPKAFKIWGHAIAHAYCVTRKCYKILRDMPFEKYM